MTNPWFKKYNDSFVKTPGQNDAGDYGVKTEAIQGATVIVAGVHHLDQSENAGKQHIWLDLRDEKGERIEGAKFRFNWEGHADSILVALDKPPDEPGANIAMWPGQVVSVWVAEIGGKKVVSDMVHGLHSTHPDEPPGNTRFHHSFWITFLLQMTPIPPPVPPPGPVVDVATALGAIADAVAALGRARKALTL